MTRPGFPADVITEIRNTEDHIHTEQLCAGDDGANGFEDNGLTPWQLTTNAAADTFGGEVQIYSGALGANVFMDLDKVVVTDIGAPNSFYIIQLWVGSGLFAAATRVHNQYELRFSTAGDKYPNLGRSPRIRGDLKIWARAKRDAAGSNTISFFLEYHKYPSDSGHEVTS